MSFTESQLKKLVEDVEREFMSHLAKAEEEAKETSLLKAEYEGKKPYEKKPKEKEANSEEEYKPEAFDNKASVTPEEKVEPACHDYDEEDMAHLEKMYMSMSEPELKLHHDVIKKCCMAKYGDMDTEETSGTVQKSELNAHGEKENPPQPKVKGNNLDNDPKNGGIDSEECSERNGGKIEVTGEPKGSPGAQSPASKDQRNLKNMKKSDNEPKGSPGAKSPASKDQKNLNNMEKSENAVEVELLKSELQATNDKYEELKKSFDAVQEFLTKLVKKTAAPTPKAIESLETIAKGEDSDYEQPLTKSEINAKLLAKSKDPKTSSADRDAINRYYLNGESIKGISHLLE